jgi:arylsulfatase A-like enzyme
MMLALGFGLATGLGEIVLRSALKFAFGHLMRVPLQFVWMAPLANVGLFALTGVAVWILGKMAPPLLSRRPVMAIFVALTFLAWLLLVPRLSPWAALLLSAGLGWQFSKMPAMREALSRWRAQVALATTILLLTLCVNAVLYFRERAATGSQVAARDGAPNVLLIIWDTVRARSLSLYGHELATTPRLEALADRGATFTQAISTSPWTLPAHASMFTGRLPHETSVAWYSPLDRAHATLAERLQEHGWMTAAFAANILYVDWEHGLFRGFAHFEDFRVTPGQIMVSSSIGGRILRGDGGWTPGFLRTLLGHEHEFIGRKWADQVNADFLAWLDNSGTDRPFFAALNFFDAHLPYAPPAPFDTLFGPRRRETSFGERFARLLDGRDKWDLGAEDLEAEVRMYEASIAYLDDRLAMLLDSLAARGVLDNTLVIVTSDHGEAFGEHEDFEHGSSLYFEQTHVPLVISLPGHVPEGFVIDEPVSTREIAATIEAIATDGTAPAMPGPSLTRFWSGFASGTPNVAVSELVPGRSPDDRMTSILATGLKYIVNVDERIELYDAERDWPEARDLSAIAGGDTLLNRLRSAVDRATSCGGLQCCCPLPPNAFPSSRGADTRAPGAIRQ